MSFFLRHPRVWIAVWAIFALGGLVMIVESLSGPIDAGQVIHGCIGIAVGLMMIRLIRTSMKSRAPDL